MSCDIHVIYCKNVILVPSCCVPAPEVIINSETSVTVRWEREQCLLRNAQQRDYILRYGLINSNKTTTTTGYDPYRSGSQTLTSLNGSSWYKFEVALVNEVGTGPYSVTVAFIGDNCSIGE